MEYLVRLRATLPDTMSDDELAQLYADERLHGLTLMSGGVMARAWRLEGPGQGLFLMRGDDESVVLDALKELPMFPYCAVEITPLFEHPLEAMAAAASLNVESG